MNEKAKQPKKDPEWIHRRSYLLRLWCVDQPGNLYWQASLEILETREHIGFANLEELFVYLMELTANKEL